MACFGVRRIRAARAVPQSGDPLADSRAASHMGGPSPSFAGSAVSRGPSMQLYRDGQIQVGALAAHEHPRCNNRGDSAKAEQKGGSMQRRREASFSRKGVDGLVLHARTC